MAPIRSVAFLQISARACPAVLPLLHLISLRLPRVRRLSCVPFLTSSVLIVSRWLRLPSAVFDTLLLISCHPPTISAAISKLIETPSNHTWSFNELFALRRTLYSAYQYSRWTGCRLILCQLDILSFGFFSPDWKPSFNSRPRKIIIKATTLVHLLDFSRLWETYICKFSRYCRSFAFEPHPSFPPTFRLRRYL